MAFKRLRQFIKFNLLTNQTKKQVINKIEKIQKEENKW